MRTKSSGSAQQQQSELVGGILESEQESALRSAAGPGTLNADSVVREFLETYAARGVFKGFSRTGEGKWRMLWHRDRYFDLTLKADKLAFAEVLPQVPARSKMMKEYRAFVAAFSSESTPEHKRIDPAKLQLRCFAKGGGVGVEATILDGDWEYAVRKLIHVVHETYLVFLYDGAYYDYLIEVFDLDPDHTA